MGFRTATKEIGRRPGEDLVDNFHILFENEEQIGRDWTFRSGSNDVRGIGRSAAYSRIASRYSPLDCDGWLSQLAQTSLVLLTT